MFYSTEVLSLKNKAGIGIVWLAGTLGPRSHARRISRKDYASVDIEDACDYLTKPPTPMSLRLQASLLVGVCRIYGQQYGMYCGLVEELWRELCIPIEQGRCSHVQQQIKEPKKPSKGVEMPTADQVNTD